MVRLPRRCAVTGCRAWALEDSLYCRAHTPQPEPDESPSAGAEQAQREHASSRRMRRGFYTGALTQSEWHDLRRYVETHATEGSTRGSTLEEVEVMRTLIRRVMLRIGEDDPARALPLVRQGVDAICRALRTQRLLSGEGADSLSAAFAVAIREIGEELGLADAAS